MPPPAGPRSWTSDRARAVLDAGRRERRAALADDPRDGGQRLDVVDDGGLAEQAALGRVGRLLLGLAALALERLEQHGLLAQHVRALDRADGDRDPVAGVERRRRRGSPPPRRRATAPSSWVTSAGSSARTARIASVAPMANAAIARPSRTRSTGRRRGARRRCACAGPRRSRWRRRSAAPAGWDAAARHFSPVGKPGAAPAAQPGGGDVAIVPVAPRSRTALRSPSKAPALTAASRSPGSFGERGDAAREDGRAVPLGREERRSSPPRRAPASRRRSPARPPALTGSPTRSPCAPRPRAPLRRSSAARSAGGGSSVAVP